MDILKRTKAELLEGTERLSNPIVAKAARRMTEEKQELRTQLRGFTEIQPVWKEIHYVMLRRLEIKNIPDPDTYNEILDWISDSCEQKTGEPHTIENAKHQMMFNPPMMFHGGTIKLFWSCPYCKKPRNEPKDALCGYQGLQVKSTYWISCDCLFQQGVEEHKYNVWSEARSNKLNPDLPSYPPLIPNQILNLKRIVQ